MHLSQLYGHSLALLTDLYQLTMAYGYWQQGRQDEEAVFHQFYRSNPFGGGYAIAAGLDTLVEYIQNFSFDNGDISYLSTLEGNNGEPLFEEDFLHYLRDLTFECDVDAVPEGTVVFPHEPLVRIKGPLIQCQLLETALLNIVNFQTLIATKAARICDAAQGEPVLEFGLRRAQGIDGGIMAARAAYIGGCAGTSNVLAGRLLDIPVKGTHAHSWVMSYESELESFEAYADALPNNCVFLVDTYDTLEGVKKAIKVGRKLRERGYEMVGIRLDSGDLAYLSIEARKLLDEAGFEDAQIVASNGLDEYTIKSLKEQGAQIRLWGVGTNLVTAKDQPALGGVYKLSAIRKDADSEWKPRIKLSEQRIKISNPGCLQVRRFYDGDEYRGDMIFNELQGEPGDTIIDPMDNTRRTSLDFDQTEDLLIPAFRDGQIQPEVHPTKTIPDGLDNAKKRAKDQLSKFHLGVKRFTNPHEYPVGLSRDLEQLRTCLIVEARRFPQED
jgi:nicotinate phosphoribosyltransferase